MMLRQDTETIWIFGFVADQISAMKRCDCNVTGRYDRRHRPHPVIADAATAAANLPSSASGLSVNWHVPPMSDGLKA